MKIIFARRLRCISAGLLIFMLGAVSAAQDEASRGFGVRARNAQGQTVEIKLYDASYALVIGEIDYVDGWQSLRGVRDDTEAVGAVLRKHGFKVETALNLTSAQFKARIDKFIGDYGYERNNRLLIYYAGHGYTLKSVGDNRELGYIVPVDAPDPNRDEKRFRQTAISLKMMQTFAEEIQAKHALFVFDSCFSGKIFAMRDNPLLPPQIEESVNNPVRQIITAGDENQKVPDESIFRKAFVRGLEGEADYNTDGYVTGIELGYFLKDKVTNYTNRRQTPRFGTINNIDLDKGDFVFAVSKNSKIRIAEPFKPEEKPKVEPNLPARGGKSGKVLYIDGATAGNKVSTDEIYKIDSEFRNILLAGLRKTGLTILDFRNGGLNGKESAQYFEGINARSDETGLRALPVALVFSVNINSLEDLPPFEGLYVSKVSGGVDLIDTGNNKTIDTELFIDVRGFGNTQEQARRNALKAAANEIPASFFDSVKEKAR